MPRVVQVASSESLEVHNRVSNTYSVDTSDSDDTLNRNYNRRVNFISESETTYLRFPMNYSLYNVTYTESENDPYCLRCVIDGQVKRFKKDARVWLHKSSDRKRKLNDGAISNGGIENSANANKNLKIVTHGQQDIECGGTYRSTPYNIGVGNDLLSEISSIGDSDADLTYSEESSPTLGASLVEIREKCREPKSVRFDESLNTDYRIHPISSDSDESVKSVEKTTSNISLPDESVSIEEIGIDFDNGNESRNNVRAAPVRLDVSKIAPAVSIETESFQESLLDYAVNLHNRASCEQTHSRGCTKVEDIGFSRLCATQTMLKMKAKKKREDRGKPYNLHSVKTAMQTDQVVPDGRQTKARSARCSGVAVQPTVACTNLVPRNQASVTDQTPSCSRTETETLKNKNVPTLFILAGRVLYKSMKSELNKIS